MYIVYLGVLLLTRAERTNEKKHISYYYIMCTIYARIIIGGALHIRLYIGTRAKYT